MRSSRSESKHGSRAAGKAQDPRHAVISEGAVSIPGTAPAGTPEQLDDGVWRTRLPDGPVVVSERIDSVRSVALGIWFRQGSIHERPAQQGISHLLEHMAFKGTERRSARAIAHEIEQVGGIADAFTTHETTVFQARAPATALERALDVLADLAFHPALRETDLELERNVILEELSAVEDTPEELLFEEHAAFLYGDHPYGRAIIGTRESVGRIDIEQLRELHARAFRSGAAVISAAGCLHHEELLELVSRLVPSHGGEAPAPPEPVTSGFTGLRRIRRPGVRQAHVVTGGLTVPYADPIRYAIVLVGTALGGGMSSRLFQRIREDLGLAYNVYSYHSFYAASGNAGAYLGTSPENVERARDLLLEELRSLAEQGLESGEIESTREQLRGRLMISLESPASRMNRLAGVELYGEPYRRLDEIADRIDGVTAAEIERAASLYHPDRLAVMDLVPLEGGESPVEGPAAERAFETEIANSHQERMR